MGILGKSKDKEIDIEATITAMLRGIAWAEPMVQLKKQLVDASAIASELKRTVKQRDSEAKALESLQGEVKTLTEQRTMVQLQAKDQQAAMVHMKEKAVAEIEMQRNEAQAQMTTMKQEADVALSAMHSKTKRMQADALQQQKTAEREYAAWRTQSSQEVADAERQLAALRRAATEMQNKVAALTP